jgi:hypothetical protein
MNGKKICAWCLIITILISVESALGAAAQMRAHGHPGMFLMGQGVRR